MRNHRAPRLGSALLLVLSGLVLSSSGASAAEGTGSASAGPRTSSGVATSVSTEVDASVVLIDRAVLSPGQARVLALDGVPTNATAVELEVTGRWSWRPTDLSLCAGVGTPADCRATPELTTPVNTPKSTRVTLALAPDAPGHVTIHNSVASVRATVAVVGYTVPAQAAVSTPGPATTGVPAGTDLRVHEGDLTITEPGTVIDGLDIRGFVRIKADDVTIRNTIVRGREFNENMHLVQASNGTKRVRIVDSELAAAHPTPYIKGIVGADFTLERVDIHSVVDQVSITGDNVTITDSWLHDNLYFEKDPNYNGTPTHDDNIQVSVGRNLRFERNRLEDTHNAAVMITQDRGDVGNVVFSGNWVDGGACSVNIAEKSYGPLAGLVFTNNQFGTATRHERCAILKPTTTPMTEHGNTFVDGHPFAISRG